MKSGVKAYCCGTVKAHMNHLEARGSYSIGVLQRYCSPAVR